MMGFSRGCCKTRSHFVLGIARGQVARVHVLVGFVSEFGELLGPVVDWAQSAGYPWCQRLGCNG